MNDVLTGVWWLSFGDGSRPRGKQALGVVIVKAGGFGAAIDESSRLGVNPGGEVRGWPVDPGKYPKSMRGRLLTKSELSRYGDKIKL